MKMLFKRAVKSVGKSVSNLKERIHNVAKKPVLKIKPRTIEYFATFCISAAALATYFYGVLSILPVMFPESPVPRIFLQILATYILGAIFSNLYLMKKRNSSIQNRMLLQPVVQPLPAQMPNMDADDQVKETTKHMGEHFRPAPFGCENYWHICAICEVFVPPRSWHCFTCGTCVLRRDHHCVFSGCCIGEENMSNFLGFVFYLSIGTTLVSIFCLYYGLYFEGLTFWWYLFRSLCMQLTLIISMGIFIYFLLKFYTFFMDFDVRWVLACLSTIGQAPAWGVLLYYIRLAMKGQTSADAHRNIIRTAPGEKPLSFKNMEQFLGPNPLLRILWPFHKPHKVDYGRPNMSPEEERKCL